VYPSLACFLSFTLLSFRCSFALQAVAAVVAVATAAAAAPAGVVEVMAIETVKQLMGPPRIIYIAEPATEPGAAQVFWKTVFGGTRQQGSGRMEAIVWSSGECIRLFMECCA
jgi:hypothetical protein